jgi:hypothetical protein
VTKWLKGFWTRIRAIPAKQWVLLTITGVIVGAVFWYRSQLWPLAKPTTVSEFWTFVGAMTQVILVVVAVVGLKALVLTRRGLLTQNKRDALSCAIAQSEVFAREIIPANEPILGEFKALHMPVFVEGETGLNVHHPTTDQVKRAQAWVAKLPPDMYSKCVKQLNRLEAWSMYFTSKLADEKLVSISCGPAFVAIVLQLYPVLVVARLPRAAGKYPHTLRLLENWLAAMEEQDLGLREGHLQRQLAEVQARAKVKSPGLGEPIGTAEVDFD